MTRSVQQAVGRLLTLLLAVGCSTFEDGAGPSLSRRGESGSLGEPEVPRLGGSAGKVTYTINRGGTLLNVANLYKLHHHEILELNPGVDPKVVLGPRTEVVVFRDTLRPSESIGLPHSGAVDGAIPMLDGPGRKITAQRWKTWATRDTVLSLDLVLRKWAEQYPGAPKVLVGNLSARAGGQLAPHKTHQSGRDVDLSYIAKASGQGALAWQQMSADNLDAELTWALLKLLDKYAEVEVVFIDREIQKLLLDHALKTGTIRKNRLASWLQVAATEGPGDAAPKVKHVSGHRDHLHVRFACPDGQKRCQ